MYQCIYVSIYLSIYLSSYFSWLETPSKPSFKPSPDQAPSRAPIRTEDLQLVLRHGLHRHLRQGGQASQLLQDALGGGTNGGTI